MAKMGRPKKQPADVSDLAEDLSTDEASMAMLSRIARDAYARGNFDAATKAIRAIAQIRGAIGAGGDARTKEVGKLGTAELIALRDKLKGAA